MIGLAAGVVLGLLVAPQKGKATRKRIAHDTDSFFSDLQTQLQSGIDNIKSQYNDFVEQSASGVKDASKQAERRSKR